MKIKGTWRLYVASDCVPDGHRLAVGHPFQHLCLVERLDEPEGQQRGQEVAELALFFPENS